MLQAISSGSADYLYDSGWLEFSHTNGTNTIIVNNDALPLNSGNPVVVLADVICVSNNTNVAHFQPQLRKGVSNIGPSFEGYTNYLKNEYNTTNSSNYSQKTASGTSLTIGMIFRIGGNRNNSNSHQFPDGSVASFVCLQNSNQEYNFYFYISSAGTTGTYSVRYRYMDLEKANEVFK